MTDQLVLELCAGYNGLGMAVEAALNARVAAFSEYDKAPSKILAYRYPGVPNYGDMTCIDWAELNRLHGPITAISGGTPCQDLSHAGRRKGMTEGTRSNLWVHMREAIAIIQPEWVVWENVRGAYSAEATSDMEQCPGCMGDATDRTTVLRALGRVLGDLSDLGYDTKWRGLRAADVGAPHSRFRVFVLARRRTAAAHDASSGRGNQAQQHDGNSETAEHWASLPDQSDSLLGRLGSDGGPITNGHTHGEDGQGSLSTGHPALRETDQTRKNRGPGPADANTDGLGHEWAGQAWDGRTGSEDSSRPPADTSDHGRGRHEERDGEPQAGLEAPCGHGTDGRSPANTDGRSNPRRIEDSEREAERREAAAGDSGGAINWGVYAAAIARWERVIGRRAPRPTEPTGRDNGQRLSARFTEWMMGLPDGWVTDPAIGISRNEQLKACGNGVVPQQAYAAIMHMLEEYWAEQQQAA